ncbi:hypothetical protein Pgy4_37156, partial [Pseudomonas savastanoi pv. glycinea str. race 4]
VLVADANTDVVVCENPGGVGLQTHEVETPVGSSFASVGHGSVFTYAADLTRPMRV